jgi:hypothetical protein
VRELIEYTAVLRFDVPRFVLDAGSERAQQTVDLIAVLVPARCHPQPVENRRPDHASALLADLLARHGPEELLLGAHHVPFDYQS